MKPRRRGWCLGNKEFLEQMPGLMEESLRPGHSGELRQESAQSRAERIVREELRRLGWTKEELTRRRKNDPAKLALAARLGKETTLTLKQIASRVSLGSSKSANAKLHQWMRKCANEHAPTSQRTAKRADKIE